MSDSWDEYAVDWDDDKDAITYSEKAYQSLVNVIQPKGLNILDFGCGTGLLTERLSPHANHITALDSSTKMISVLNDKKLPNVTTIAKPLSGNVITENEPLQVKFDLITASSVCGFLPEYEATLSLLKTLLVPGGNFVQWDWLSPENDSDFGLSIERVDAALKNAGFSNVSITQPFSLAGSGGSMPVLMGIGINA